MIRLGVIGSLVILAIWASALWYAGVIGAADPPPVSSTQPNPDTFQYQGESLAKYSADSKALRETGVWRWRFVPVSGCPSESIRPQVTAAINQMRTRWSIDVIEAPATDTTAHAVYATCGSSFAAVCGGPPVIGCLGRGYPYNNDVDISTDMASFFDVSQRSITLHEVAGHAAGVWNEQYIARTFAASSDVTIMNTGPNSRHDLGPEEDARWWRTMGSPMLKTLGYGNNGAWYVWACNFHENATRLAVLVDLKDGQGVRWTGVTRPIVKDANGCMGIGVPEGLRIVIGAEYMLKQENPGSWRVSLNETRVPG